MLVLDLNQFCQNFNAPTILDALLANKYTRQGALPGPDVQQKIRTVVDDCLRRQVPIPILTVGGCIKAVKELEGRPDLAEVLAFQTFNALNERIRKIFQPGIRVTMRMEDLTEIYNISYQQEVRPIVSSYLLMTCALVRQLKFDWLRLIPESNLAYAGDWHRHTETYVPMFYTYLRDSEGKPAFHHEAIESYKALRHMGWVGPIDTDARLWFRERYLRLYGDESEDERLMRMSYYLSGILTRVKLKATAYDGHIRICMNSPLPLYGITQPRLYYRTFPGHEHRPWWSSIGAWNSVTHTPKLLNPHTAPKLQYEFARVNGADMRLPMIAT